MRNHGDSPTFSASREVWPATGEVEILHNFGSVVIDHAFFSCCRLASAVDT